MAYQGINQPKPTGFPMDNYREHVQAGQTAIYNTGQGGLALAPQALATDTDDFRFNSTISQQPNDLGVLLFIQTSNGALQTTQNLQIHLRDVTIYPEGAVKTASWGEHLRGKQGRNDTNSNV